MKKRQFIQSITFFVTEEMYDQVYALTFKREIGMSELMRELLTEHLNSLGLIKPDIEDTPETEPKDLITDRKEG